MTNALSPDVVTARVRHAVFALIEAQGLSRSQVCAALCDTDGRAMSRSALDTRRTGQTRFYAHELAQLAALLQAPVGALLTGDVEVVHRGDTVYWRAGGVTGTRSLDSVLTSFVTDGVRLPPPRRTSESDTDTESEPAS